MAAFDRVLDGIKQVLLMTEEIKRLSGNVTALGIEMRDIDRRVSRLEGVIVGRSQPGTRPRKRLERKVE
jgi:hypothetical protein